MAKQNKLNWIERWQFQRALRKYESKKKTWDKNDEKTRQDVLKAIDMMLKETEIEMFEDDECTIPTTREVLEKKDLQHLIEDFDMIIKAIQGKLNDE